MVLQAPKSSGMYQAQALGLAYDTDVGLLAGVQELEGDGAAPVTEAMAMALLEACKAVKCVNVVGREFRRYRSACGGAPGVKVLSSTCLALVACEKAASACDFYEKEMAPNGRPPMPPSQVRY